MLTILIVVALVAAIIARIALAAYTKPQVMQATYVRQEERNQLAASSTQTQF